VRAGRRAAPGALVLLSFLSSQDKDGPFARAADQGERPTVADGGAGGGPTSRQATAAVRPPGPAPVAGWDADDLIVGTKHALEVWDREGKRKGTLSVGEAQHPRWLDHDTIVVLRPRDESLGHGAAVELVDSQSGRRHRVARIPGFRCATKDPSDDDMTSQVDLQDETDFVVDGARGRACLSLMDRNINMGEIAVEIVIDLKSGKIRRWLSLGEDACRPPKGVTVGSPDSSEGCRGSSLGVPSIGDETAGFAFRARNVEDDIVIEGKSPGSVLVRSYQRAGDSPSGRFELLHGEQEDGDYIHFKALIFDRQTGQLFPVTQKPGRWPKPLPVVGKARRHIKTPVERAGDLVGETPLRWLGPAEHEVLLVEKSVLVPYECIFELPGDLIF